MTGDDKRAPTLEDALGGLLDAAAYCESQGMSELARECCHIYQSIGEQAPEEDCEGDGWTIWDEVIGRVKQAYGFRSS